MNEHRGRDSDSVWAYDREDLSVDDQIPSQSPSVKECHKNRLDGLVKSGEIDQPRQAGRFKEFSPAPSSKLFISRVLRPRMYQGDAVHPSTGEEAKRQLDRTSDLY